MSKSPYRYPGTQPFSSDQKALFFGREKDILRLHRLVKTQNLVVLYGKSGLGKSSLLNAGLLPLVEREGEHTPIQVRFNAWTEESTETPVVKMLHLLSPEGSRDTFLDSLIFQEPSLWHELKEAQTDARSPKQYLLIFDQFEELFTYPPDQIAAFRDQLAEALYTKIPPRYREVLEQQLESGTCRLSEADFDLLQQQPDVHIVLSIRSDRMHLMERLSDALPDILSHCYELHALSPEGAQKAIEAPAALRGDFRTAPFRFTPGALSDIISFLDDADGRIETVQLQIICRNLEERAAQENIRLFDQNNLGDLEAVIAQFYHRQLAVLGDEEARLPMRRLIEDGLIAAEDRQRLTLHEAQIAGIFKVPKEQLHHLVDGGLLRAEPALRGGYAYELSHDTLVEPALTARRARKAKEESVALSEERRKRYRARRIAIGFGLLSLLSVCAALYAWGQTRKARMAESEAVRQREQAKEMELKARESAEKERLSAIAAGQALSEKERAEMAEMAAREATEALARKGTRLEKSITGADTYRYLMEKGRNFLIQEGDYRNALTYFATAQFMDDTPEARRMLELAQKGARAEQAFAQGHFDVAAPLYSHIVQAAPEAHAAKRMEQMRHATTVWEAAQQPSARALYLNSKELYTLPAFIGQYKQLDTLDISNNFFSTLPPSVFGLTHLKELICTEGNLQSVGSEIGRLTELRHLDLSTNRSLNFLSPAIGQLTQLEVLNLKYCGLRALPAETGLARNLRTLQLSDAAIEHLPTSLTRLNRLESLSLAAMPHLNWETNFPTICRLTSLRYLNLAGNDLQELPVCIGQLKQLTELDLSQNNLVRLPPEIAELKSLKVLHLHKNKKLSEAARLQVQKWLPQCEVR